MILTAEKRFLTPDNISVVDVSIRDMVAMQRAASKITWRPSPGRHICKVVVESDNVIALICLGSPVMNMRARDRFLNLPLAMRAKGLALKHYMDLSVCVGIQPLAWYWNLGKCAAMIAPTLGADYLSAYGDELKGIVTTSVWGRSSQYNRVYQEIGRSGGMGSEHISEERFQEMKQQLIRAGWKGSNWKHSRMAVISEHARFLGHSPKDGITHGHKRGIYYHASTLHDWKEAVRLWYNRWGLSRYERVQNELPPYLDGLSGGRDATEKRTQEPIGRLFY